MGQANDNVMMRQNRGMVGEQVVFKRRAGKAYVAAPHMAKECHKHLTFAIQ